MAYATALGWRAAIVLTSCTTAGEATFSSDQLVPPFPPRAQGTSGPSAARRRRRAATGPLAPRQLGARRAVDVQIGPRLGPVDVVATEAGVNRKPAVLAKTEAEPEASCHPKVLCGLALPIDPPGRLGTVYRGACHPLGQDTKINGNKSKDKQDTLVPAPKRGHSHQGVVRCGSCWFGRARLAVKAVGRRPHGTAFCSGPEQGARGLRLALPLPLCPWPCPDRKRKVYTAPYLTRTRLRRVALSRSQMSQTRRGSLRRTALRAELRSAARRAVLDAKFGGCRNGSRRSSGSRWQPALQQEAASEAALQQEAASEAPQQEVLGA